MQLITQTDELLEWLSGTEFSGRLALDTEFMRERTYTPTLALIQCADDHRIMLIDPTAEIDLSALWRRLCDPQTACVWHSGRQDLEVLWPLLQTAPAQLWDTQIGAALLGLKPQMGYAELAHTLLGVVVDKSQTRTDWLKRPLSPEQIAYAATDVQYLIPILDTLKERLIHLGRLAWWLEEMTAFAEINPTIDPESAWERLKGLERLKPIIRTRMCRLSIWREREAQRLNIPRSWITDDGGLERMSIGPFPDESVWPRIGHPSLTVQPNFGAAKHIADSTDIDDQFQVAYLERPSETEKKRLQALKNQLQKLATRLQIDETFLCPQRALKALARGHAYEQVFTGWRAEQLIELQSVMS
jgi:ribonuclease D